MRQKSKTGFRFQDLHGHLMDAKISGFREKLCREESDLVPVQSQTALTQLSALSVLDI